MVCTEKVSQKLLSSWIKPSMWVTQSIISLTTGFVSITCYTTGGAWGTTGCRTEFLLCSKQFNWIPTISPTWDERGESTLALWGKWMTGGTMEATGGTIDNTGDGTCAGGDALDGGCNMSNPSPSKPTSTFIVTVSDFNFVERLLIGGKCSWGCFVCYFQHTAWKTFINISFAF